MSTTDFSPAVSDNQTSSPEHNSDLVVTSKTTDENKSSNISTISIVALLIFIGIIIGVSWYFVQRNKTNTPHAIITNFGTTYISHINGNILSVNLDPNSGLGGSEGENIMTANGTSGDVTTGWTLTSTSKNNPNIVSIQNNFTEKFCGAGKDGRGSVYNIIFVSFDSPLRYPEDKTNWFKITTTTVKGRNNNVPDNKDTTITLLSFESELVPGKFIIANTDGSISLDKPIICISDYLFQVVN